MKVVFEQIRDLETALELAPLLDRAAAEQMAEFRDEPLPARVGERFLGAHFDAPETLWLRARTPEGAELGFVLTGPAPDPLVGEVVPMILLLRVEVEWRHRGIARALVQEASRRLREAGHATLAARAGHNDDALISMGERWGFVRQWETMLLD